MAQTLHLPRGCLGVDHFGGASFKADRRGHVTVPDRVAEDFRRNGVLRYYDLTDPGGTLLSSSEPGCRSCAFAPWPWQIVDGRCPRCGNPMEEPADGPVRP